MKYPSLNILFYIIIKRLSGKLPIFAEYNSSHNKINKTDVLQIFLRFFLQIRQFFYLLNQYNISILQMYRFLLHLLLQIRKCSPAPPQNRPRRLFLLSQYLQRCLYL